jgi:hypothetical protein
MEKSCKKAIKAYVKRGEVTFFLGKMTITLLCMEMSIEMRFL